MLPLQWRPDPADARRRPPCLPLMTPSASTLAVVVLGTAPRVARIRAAVSVSSACIRPRGSSVLDRLVVMDHMAYRLAIAVALGRLPRSCVRFPAPLACIVAPRVAMTPACADCIPAGQARPAAQRDLFPGNRLLERGLRVLPSGCRILAPVRVRETAADVAWRGPVRARHGEPGG